MRRSSKNNMSPTTVPALGQCHQCNCTGCQVLGGAKMMVLFIFCKGFTKLFSVYNFFCKKIHTYIKNVLNLKTFWSWGDTERRLALVTIIHKAGSGYGLVKLRAIRATAATRATHNSYKPELPIITTSNMWPTNYSSQWITNKVNI